MAKTANGVGISARSEIVVSYGLAYDLTRSPVMTEEESDKKFKAKLLQPSFVLMSCIFLTVLRALLTCSAHAHNVST